MAEQTGYRSGENCKKRDKLSKILAKMHEIARKRLIFLLKISHTRLALDFSVKF